MQTLKAAFPVFRPSLWLLLWVGGWLMACQNTPKSPEGKVEAPSSALKQMPDPAQQAPKEALTSEQVLTLVANLPIAQRANKQINDFTQGRQGVSLLVENSLTDMDGQEYYTVRIGYNGQDRYETYHILLVNKQDKKDIRIEDVVTAEMIPIEQWEREHANE
jgi:hypothetical protein